MKAIGVIVTVLAGSAVLGACTKQPTDGAKSAAVANAVKVPDKVFGTGSFPINDCNGVAAPQTGQEYKINIGKDFVLTNPTVTKGGHKEGKPQSHPHKTVLDIVTDGLADGQSAMVIVTLDDPLLSFQDQGLAVRGNDSDSQAIFCSVKLIPNPDPNLTPRALTFIVHRDAGGPTHATYNLGLVATDKRDGVFKLPVFIDPDVTNDG